MVQAWMYSDLYMQSEHEGLSKDRNDRGII